MPDPRRGELWIADLNPVRGHEQSGRRPVLVLSEDLFNASAAGLVVVIPATTRDKQIPFHVAIAPPEGGVKRVSYLKCEDIRSIARERLIERWDRISEETLREVEYRLRLLLRL